jgi:cytidylate kinase
MKSSSSKPTRGRPRIELAASTSLTTWVRASDYDRLAQIAKREEKSLSAIVRELVKLKLG